MRFKSADHAVEAYALLFDRASSARPQKLSGHSWADKCQRPTCPSIQWIPKLSKRRGIYEARCSICNSLWRGERIALPRLSQLSIDDPRDRILAEVATLHLIIRALPDWERRVIVAFVLHPEPGRREDLVSADFRERWPWEIHAKGIHLACEDATEYLPSRAPRDGKPKHRERQRDWTPYRVRLLLLSARRRLESSLDEKGLLDCDL